jgi:hypothetical protein
VDIPRPVSLQPVLKTGNKRQRKMPQQPIRSGGALLDQGRRFMNITPGFLTGGLGTGDADERGAVLVLGDILPRRFGRGGRVDQVIEDLEGEAELHAEIAHHDGTVVIRADRDGLGE